MAFVDEASEALAGSWLLAKRDTSGYVLFNDTAAGFWRSFAAILLIAPFYFMFIEMEAGLISPPDGGGEVDMTRFHVAGYTALVVHWFAYPFVLFMLARPLGFASRYILYVVAYNWSAVLVVIVMSVPVYCYRIGILDAATAGFANVLLVLPALYYRWFIARTALAINGALASSVVALDVTLSFVVNAMFR